MACVGGGIDVDWLVLAAACCVRGLVSGGGRGGVVSCGLVWAGGWVLRGPCGPCGDCCGAGVCGRMSVRVGLWSVCNGWLLVDGARWYGVWVGGLGGGGGGGGGGGCCAGWGSGRPCGSCGCCVCAPCGPCGS